MQHADLCTLGVGTTRWTTSLVRSTTVSNVKQILEDAMTIDGAIGIALADFKSGMLLGSAGGSAGLNLEVAAAGNSEVLRSKQKVMGNLGLKDKIEDVLITLGSQYHLIRPLSKTNNLFMYLVLNKSQANLAMGRHKLAELEGRLEV
jgi:hypothetical protein